jgi:hypothetical protein
MCSTFSLPSPLPGSSELSQTTAASTCWLHRCFSTLNSCSSCGFLQMWASWNHIPLCVWAGTAFRVFLVVSDERLNGWLTGGPSKSIFWVLRKSLGGKKLVPSSLEQELLDSESESLYHSSQLTSTHKQSHFSFLLPLLEVRCHSSYKPFRDQEFRFWWLISLGLGFLIQMVLD